jgi:hypothetical protein
MEVKIKITNPRSNSFGKSNSTYLFPRVRYYRSVLKFGKRLCITLVCDEDIE